MPVLAPLNSAISQPCLGRKMRKHNCGILRCAQRNCFQTSMAAAAAAPTPVLVLPPSDICKPASCVSSEASAALQQALTQTTAHLRHALIAACIYFNPLTPALCILQQWRCAIASEPLSHSLVSRAHVGCFCPYPRFLFDIPSCYLSPSFPLSSHTNSLLRPPTQHQSRVDDLKVNYPVLGFCVVKF